MFNIQVFSCNTKHKMHENKIQIDNGRPLLYFSMHVRPKGEEVNYSRK